MRYPNQRYGHPDHLKYYMGSWTPKQLAKHLKRDERTIRNWLSGAQKMPWWVPELLRLERYEKHQQLRQMGINQKLGKLGVVRGQVIDYVEPKAAPFDFEKEKASILDEMNALLIAKGF